MGPRTLTPPRMPRSAPIESMVERAVGIYGSAPTCYLSALARLPSLTIAALDRALETDRTLVRVRAMRYSVYTFPRERLGVALAATRGDAFAGIERRARHIAQDYPKLCAAVEGALADGPLASAEIRARVDPDRALGSWFSLVLGRMAGECRIVRATTTGGWRSNRLTYARWSDWLPDVDPFAVDEREAKRELADWYVAAYGPVELEDLRWWTGWKVADTRAVADGLDLARTGRALEDLTGVRLLPVWDVLMVAYRHRDRLFDPELAPFLYDKMGNATSVVLDGGRVVGVWDLGRSNDPLRIRVAPLGRWPKRRWGDVEAEAGRVATRIGAGAVEVTRVAEPVDLTEAPRNRFLSPLPEGDAD